MARLIGGLFLLLFCAFSAHADLDDQAFDLTVLNQALAQQELLPARTAGE
jgi:hypothetical protein